MTAAVIELAISREGRDEIDRRVLRRALIDLDRREVNVLGNRLHPAAQNARPPTPERTAAASCALIVRAVA